MQAYLSGEAGRFRIKEPHLSNQKVRDDQEPACTQHSGYSLDNTASRNPDTATTAAPTGVDWCSASRDVLSRATVSKEAVTDYDKCTYVLLPVILRQRQRQAVVSDIKYEDGNTPRSSGSSTVSSERFGTNDEGPLSCAETAKTPACC